MTYEIQSKSDLLTGATLMIRIPEEDLDKKALYTILDDKPGYILPFHHRVIDGQIEFVYQIGSQCKLQYLTGNCSPNEYTQMWSSLLTPLFDCNDWFLRPYSFALDIKHLYCCKSSNAISYVYIPSIRDCSDYQSLREMTADFSRQITVADAELENKVLRAIMMDFNPKTILQMLKSYTPVIATVESMALTPSGFVIEQKALPAHQDKNREDIAPEPGAVQDGVQGAPGEIVIDISSSWKPDKKNRQRKRAEAITKNTNEKPQKNRKDKDKSRKKDNSQSNTPTAHDQPAYSAPLVPNITSATAQQHSPIITSQHSSATIPPYSAPFPILSPVFAAQAMPETITQNSCFVSNGAWLRLVGNASLPPAIDVPITEGEVFTVGRYDVSAGRQRSCFEFDKMTKAVSRRHAAIELSEDGYRLIDLSSSAGTFLDGQKLPPNTPCKLQPGCRVSFGNSGADYVWEQ